MMNDRISYLNRVPRRVIGLTGGIGMGKTTVSNYLAMVHHVPILDADVYAREAVQPGSRVLQEIVERYGARILMPDGTLDRLRLSEIIFQNPSERLWLEQQIHPYVRDRIETELQTLATQPCFTVVLDIPLLFEARMTNLVTEIWVVYCPPDQQIERLMQRQTKGSNSSKSLKLDQIHARIKSQMAIEKKIQQADIVLNNSSTLEALFQQIDFALSSTCK